MPNGALRLTPVLATPIADAYQTFVAIRKPEPALSPASPIVADTFVQWMEAWLTRSVLTSACMRTNEEQRTFA